MNRLKITDRNVVCVCVCNVCVYTPCFNSPLSRYSFKLKASLIPQKGYSFYVPDKLIPD